MQFMGELYVGESILTKEYDIVRKVHNSKVVPNLYLLAISTNPDNMLDLIPQWEVLQKLYPKEMLRIVGLANGKKEAVKLVERIIQDSLQETGVADIRPYLEQKWEGQACR